ncbi:hypothetical protein ACN4FU_03960 [Aliarcobacter butzleri]|uniref:hypothetical protein n=2 Tax=Aliarcobacter butzleri TaxID=28197 RepID=UPI003AF8C704
MDKLPQRDDLIYKEIEEFEDYELTNCVAYEMAIRNKEVKRLVQVLKKMEHLRKSLKPKERINWKKNRRDYYPIVENKLTFNVIKKELKNKYFIDFNKKQIINNKSEKLKDSLGFISFIPKLQSIEANEFRAKEFEKWLFIDEIGKNEIIKDGYYSIQTYYKKDNKYKNKIYTNFKKELIKPYTKTEIELNLNLPKEELIAYISKIKDDFDKDNSIIKTPLELLGEILENENIDIKNLPKRDIKKIYADMFFIYDYFIFQDKKYKNEREKLKNELEIKIKEINKKWDYDKSDKKAEIEEQKNDYKINKQKYSKEQIIDELMKELKFNRTKVNDYLKIMRMFIDDLEYKKLLTGGLKLY